ncbi:Gfo/Idh/MocA family oxidoreductase [Alphaproteobacteria bacterium]|nr:Gfo/Idh/MocA family oxidoreductase [Alphaproteobacteria bacterium]
MEKIRSAVIGCGRMGAFSSDLMQKAGPKCWFPLSHIEALKEFNEISLDAICDVNPSLLEKARIRYSINHTYSDYYELFSNHEIDLLCVATRTPGRDKIIQIGIEHGVKAFHLEKPLCNSMTQLSKLESLVTSNNVCLSYGTLRRYLNIYQKAKDIVDSGKFGKLLQIQVNFGEAALLWTHPHSVDLILFFSGKRKLKAVQSHLSNVVFIRDNIVESDPVIEQSMMYFDDGLVGSISKIPGMDVVLGCEKGVITVESNGRQIAIKQAFNGSPYFEYSKDLITDACNKSQGTYSAISNLLENLNKKDYQKNQFVFLGQKVLFGFVDSHLNNGKLIDIDMVSDKIKVIGKTGIFYA